MRILTRRPLGVYRQALFFSVQMHVAFSSLIRGAAIFAGGPYDCAQDSVQTAEMQCMFALPPPNPSTSIATTDSRAAAGSVDATVNLANSQVYMFSGAKDATVKPPVMDALYSYYTHYIPASQVHYVKNVSAAHTQPTDDPVNTEPCSVSQSPYISDCNYDGAGEALNWLALPATLKPRNDQALNGTIIEWDQTAFCPNRNCAALSLADSGYAYVPTACGDGEPCMLFLAFHGCQQNYNAVGLQWVENSGFNKWADTNAIVVLYPQTIASMMSPSNPEGCWDWWGYVEKDYDTHTGSQMAFTKAMLEKAAASH